MMATRIERIEIGAFGCLSDVVLTPAPGVNLLEAPNEAGKSTLAAFIKFVLYGFSSTRSQSIAENEKKLYMPWNGTRASGSLVVVCPSGSFRVERTYDLPSKEHVEIVNLQTRKPVFQSLVPGEVLFGAPEELFVKSAYFRQLFQSKNGDDALAEQVQNILFSADERISAEKAQKRLREAKAELRNAQNRGVIPELEGKLASYQAESERGTELNDRIRVCNETITKNTAELSRDREKLERLQDERRNIEKYAARTQLERLRAVDAAEAEAKRRYDSAAAEFSGADIPDTSAVKELMNDNAQYMAMLKERDRLAYESRTATDAYEATAAVCARWVGEEPVVRAALAREKRLFPTFLLLGVGLLAFGIACFFMPRLGAIFGGAALALGAAGLLAALLVKRRARALPAKFGYADKKELLCALSELPQIRKQCELEERRAYELNARYGESISRCGEMESSIAARIRRYRSEKDDGSTAELLDRLLNLSGEISALSAAYESARRARTEAFDGVDVEGLRTLAEGAQPPPRPAADVDREIRFHTQKIDSLNEIVRRAEREKAALEAQSPDLAALRGQMSAVEHTLRRAAACADRDGRVLHIYAQHHRAQADRIRVRMLPHGDRREIRPPAARYPDGDDRGNPRAAESGLPLLGHEGQRLPLPAAGAAAAALRAVRAAADGAGRRVRAAGREAPAGAALRPRPHVRGKRDAGFPVHLRRARTAAAGQARRAVHPSGLAVRKEIMSDMS